MTRNEPRTRGPANRLHGYGVFACRLCGAAIPPTYEWVTRGLSMRSVWEAGYCSVDHQQQGQRRGWPDDPREQRHG